MDETEWKQHRENLNRPPPEPEPTPYKLSGSNAVGYAEKDIDEKNSLLGNRYLTRRSGMFLIAPSGQGKSTVVMQAMVCWAAGRPGFDICPVRPLRFDLIQAEDDEGDLVDMAKVLDYLGLSELDRQRIAANTWIETVNDKVGPAAISAIDQILTFKPCDILILNPYTAYLGANIMDDEANSLFLRAELQRLANKHNCAILIVHHTPKTNFRQKTERWSVTDWMYSGSGAAVLTNWARAILAIDPIGETGLFKFIAAKRHQRIGWDSKINYFRHDERPGVLLWSKATALEIANATGKAGGGHITPEQVIEAVPILDGISMMRLRTELEKKTTQRAAKSAIDLALEDGFIHAEVIKGPGHAGRIKMIFRGGEDLLNGAEPF